MSKKTARVGCLGLIIIIGIIGSFVSKISETKSTSTSASKNPTERVVEKVMEKEIKKATSLYGIDYEKTIAEKERQAEETEKIKYELFPFLKTYEAKHKELRQEYITLAKKSDLGVEVDHNKMNFIRYKCEVIYDIVKGDIFCIYPVEVGPIRTKSIKDFRSSRSGYA